MAIGLSGHLGRFGARVPFSGRGRWRYSLFSAKISRDGDESDVGHVRYRNVGRFSAVRIHAANGTSQQPAGVSRCVYNYQRDRANGFGSLRRTASRFRQLAGIGRVKATQNARVR